MNRQGLAICGSFIWNDGYGRITTQIALGALELGWDTFLMDINDEDATKKYGHPTISRYYDDLFRYNNTQYQLSHYPPNVLPFQVSHLTDHTYFCTFETTRPPLKWKERIERVANRLITTSEWAKKVFEDALDLQVPIHVIPHGVEVKQWEFLQWRNEGPFRMLIAASNPLDTRKNGMTAVSAFQAAFPRSEFGPQDVQLWIKGFHTPNWSFDEDDRISYMRGDFNNTAMTELYRSCHLFLAPFRGEGFGLMIFEAMANGCVPVITDWSTPGEILTEEDSFKIPVKKMVTVDKDFPGNPFLPEIFEYEDNLGEWAEPRFDTFVEIIRDAQQDRDSITPKALAAYDRVLKMPVEDMVKRTLEVVTGQISP